MKRWLWLSIAGLSLSGSVSFLRADEDKKAEGEKPIVKPREAEVRKGDREGEKDRPKEGERKVAEKGDKEKPREFSKDKAPEVSKDKPRKDGEGEREVAKDKPREGEKGRDVPKERGREGEVAKKPHSEAEAIERRMHELHSQLKKHAEAGRHEDVARLKREIEELHRAHAPKGGEHAERGEHLKQATQHILEASKHLRAAGMPDVAEHLVRQAKEMAQHAGKRGDREHDGPPHAREGARRGEMEEQLHDLALLVKKLNERLERLEMLQGPLK